MIIENGTIQTISTTGGGMLHGRPVEVQETRSEPMWCNIKTNTDDRKGRTVDSVFRRTEYEVLIDTAEVERFTAERVVLTDNRGHELGEFRVQDVQHMDAVGAIKITVCHAD
jgi:hypothetical protein